MKFLGHSLPIANSSGKVAISAIVFAPVSRGLTDRSL